MDAFDHEFKRRVLNNSSSLVMQCKVFVSSPITIFMTVINSESSFETKLEKFINTN